jgi:hypothetical protein
MVTQQSNQKIQRFESLEVMIVEISICREHETPLENSFKLGIPQLYTRKNQQIQPKRTQQFSTKLYGRLADDTDKTAKNSLLI